MTARKWASQPQGPPGSGVWVEQKCSSTISGQQLLFKRGVWQSCWGCQVNPWRAPLSAGAPFARCSIWLKNLSGNLASQRVQRHRPCPIVMKKAADCRPRVRPRVRGAWGLNMLPVACQRQKSLKFSHVKNHFQFLGCSSQKVKGKCQHTKFSGVGSFSKTHIEVCDSPGKDRDPEDFLAFCAAVQGRSPVSIPQVR